MNKTNKLTFEYIESEGYATLKLNGLADADGVKLIEADCLAKAQTKPGRSIVVNCENLSEISPQGIRLLVTLQRTLKTTNHSLRLIAVKSPIAKYMAQQGVNDVLPIKNSLRDALVDFGLVTQKALDVNFINPFLNATMNVLKIQASTESKAGTLYKRDSKDNFQGDISGIIGLVSEAFTGSVVISFPEQTFLKIISKMLGETYTKLSPEIQDGAGELTNIIFGQAKVVLNEKGYGIKTAIPSVIMGKDHQIQNISNGPRISVPFQSDAGDFFVEICVSS